MNPGRQFLLEESEFKDGRGYVVRRARDGQRLSWRTLPKSKGLESINVVGESYRMDDLQNEAFAPGRELSLVPEPDNPADPNAIAVCDAEPDARANGSRYGFS